MKKIMALSLLVTAITMAALLPALSQKVAFFNDAKPIETIAPVNHF